MAPDPERTRSGQAAQLDAADSADIDAPSVTSQQPGPTYPGVADQEDMDRMESEGGGAGSEAPGSITIPVPSPRREASSR
jgi:hypothetical protein